MSSIEPKNIILYGPPGTGKTYATAKMAVDICNEGEKEVDSDEIKNVYNRLLKEGRIEFVTFHQSMSYEDFVEGLRPDTRSSSSEGLRLKAHPGIFRRLVRRANRSLKVYSGDKENESSNGINLKDRRIFKVSIGSSSRNDDYLFEDALKEKYIPINIIDIDISEDKYEDKSNIKSIINTKIKSQKKSEKSINMLHKFRNLVRVGDIIVISKGRSKFIAIGEICGDYYFNCRMEGGYGHRRNVKWHWINKDGLDVSYIHKANFARDAIYILKKNDINIENICRLISSQNSGEKAKGQHDKRPLCQLENYVLIIDEINRANVSKVFGELITLIEPDKRLGMPNELVVRLPYSRKKFGVPKNLHIIGTMNTADRSIMQIDTALRRRFRFHEMMPELKPLPADCEVNLRDLLRTLNNRIEYFYDKEHQIGHAYFLECRTKDDVDQVMRNHVIPLLSEYFFDDMQKVALVLGDYTSGENQSEGGFLNCTKIDSPPGAEDENNGPRFRWSVRSEKFDYSMLTEVDET